MLAGRFEPGDWKLGLTLSLEGWKLHLCLLRAAWEKELLWGSHLAPKWQFRALLGFTPALLLKGNLAKDLFPGITLQVFPSSRILSPQNCNLQCCFTCKIHFLTEKLVLIYDEIRLRYSAPAWELVTSSSTSWLVSKTEGVDWAVLLKQLQIKFVNFCCCHIFSLACCLRAVSLIWWEHESIRLTYSNAETEGKKLKCTVLTWYVDAQGFCSKYCLLFLLAS